MKHIWLIRHGQSMSQIDETVPGLNPPLSPLGEQQARALVPRVKDLHTDVVFVSPLIRACRTYQLSQIGGDRIAFNKCALECTWGHEDAYADVDFQSLADIAEIDVSDRHLLPARDRAELLIADIVAAHGESFVVFGHCCIFSQIFKTFFNTNSAGETRAVSENTAVSKLVITHDSVRLLEYWNDHNHVPSLEANL